MSTERIVLLLLFVPTVLAVEDHKACGQDKHCVPYDQCNEGLYVDGRFYPDRSRTLQDLEHCHYMEKCCRINETLPLCDSANYEDLFKSQQQQCGARLDLWFHLRPLGYKQQEAKFGEFPWLIAIFDADRYLCSGALITPLAVLTAAHCVRNASAAELLLVAGEWDAAVQLEPLPHQERAVAELLPHPNYTQAPAGHNLALLLLQPNDPFQLTAHIQPICLPPPRLVYNYSQCYVAGWRRYDFDRNETLPKRWPLFVLPQDQCAAKLRLASLGRRSAGNDSLLCTGGDKDAFVCGDLGAIPLMCPLPGSDDRYVLAGLLARAARCDGPQLLGIYSNIQFYRRWIDHSLRERDLDTRQYMV